MTTDNSGGGGEVTHPYCHPESATRPQHHLLDRFYVVCSQYRVKTTFPDSLSPSTQIFSFFLLIDMDVFMSMKACAWRQKIWKLGQSREVCDSLCNHAEYRHGSNQRCHMSVARLWAEVQTNTRHIARVNTAVMWPNMRTLSIFPSSVVQIQYLYWDL